MRLLSELFFYGYTLLLVAAGAWGMVGARLDHRILFGLDIDRLEPTTAASVVTQYRFLRAIEMGFGMFAILFQREIYSEKKFNYLFLLTMVAGVVARLVSLRLDGRPRKIFYFFLLSEAAGAIVIYFYTNRIAGLR